MRILYLINSVEGGGAALPVPRIAQALALHGAETHVFALTRRDGRSIAAFENAGIPLTVREGGRKDHLAAYRWIKDVLRRERPDVLWTSLTRATVLGQRAAAHAGLPVVSWQHAAYLKPGSRFLLRRQKHLSQLWIGDSDRVTKLTASRLNVEAERLLTWPIFAADPAAPAAKPWNGSEPLRIGSLGRLHRIKGYDVLAEAIGQLHSQGFRASVDWEVSVAGDGPDRERLERLVADMTGNSMRVIGYESDPPAFLANLHAYVQPSRSEGFCIAAHEAMQAGLPVIASAVGGMASSVQEGRSGWLVPPNDVGALANGLAAMLSEPDRLASMGRAARQYVFDQFGQDEFNATAGVIIERLAGLVQKGRSATELPISQAA